jgi:hypothetical protein
MLTPPSALSKASQVSPPIDLGNDLTTDNSQPCSFPWLHAVVCSALETPTLFRL